MIRLRRDDFEDPLDLAKLAAAARLPVDAFRREFEYLIATEPPPLVIDPERHTLIEDPHGPGARATHVVETAATES